MNQQLLDRAALGEREINERLAVWLTARVGREIKVGAVYLASKWVLCGDGEKELVHHGEVIPMLYRDEQIGHDGAFTRSLDSMALITGAMTQEERDDQVFTLRQMLKKKPFEAKFTIDDIIACVSADAETRAVAAVLALGLGGE